MWIVFFVATVASLSAMGLIPDPVPVEVEEDRARENRSKDYDL